MKANRPRIPLFPIFPYLAGRWEFSYRLDERLGVILTVLGIVGLVVSVNAYSAAIPIVNAGFENPNSITPPGYGPDISGWNVFSGEIHLVRYDYPGVSNKNLIAIDGEQFLDLNGFSPGSVVQTASLILSEDSVGELSFYYGTWSDTLDAPFEVFIKPSSSPSVSKSYTAMGGREWENGYAINVL